MNFSTEAPAICVHARITAAWLSFVWVIATAASLGSAAELYSEDAVKAAFLLRFCAYIDWPADTPAQSQFTIAVLGSAAVERELQRLLPGHSVDNRPVQVRTITKIEDLGSAQVLYLGKDFKGNLRTVSAALAGRPVLLVSDSAGGLDEGSTVNFLLVDRRLRFEISLNAAARSRLKMSSELLSVAAHVQGRSS